MKESQLLAFLKATYKPDLILYIGSRASGQAKKGSDWDIFCVGNYPSRDSTNILKNGEHLDIVTLPLRDARHTKGVIGHYYGPFRYVRVAWARNSKTLNFGAKIVAATSEAYRKGPKITSKVRAEMTAELERRVKKMKANIKDPFTIADQKGLFFRSCAEYWCTTRGMWPMPPKETFPLMQKLEPKSYKLFLKFTCENKGEKILKLGSQIRDSVLKA